MGTTSPDNLPYPGDGDPPDGPGQLGALAAAVQTALTARTTALAGKAASSHTHDGYAIGYIGGVTGGTTVTSTTTISAGTASGSVTLTSGRRYLVLVRGQLSNTSGTDTFCGADVKLYVDGSLQLTTAVTVENNASSGTESFTNWALITGSGSTTFEMKVDRTSSAGIASLAAAGWIVIDLGDV